MCACYKLVIVMIDVIWRRLCKYDLRKGDLFVLSWGRVRRGRISLELLMCGRGVRSIVLLPLVARYNRCIWHMFLFISVIVTVWWVCGNGV